VRFPPLSCFVPVFVPDSGGLTDKLLSQSHDAECALGHSSRFAESGFRLKARNGYREVEQGVPASQLADSFRGVLFFASARYSVKFIHAA
jgi:hypothetical protein